MGESAVESPFAREADDGRWEAQAIAEEAEDRKGFIDLPPAEQIARGKTILSMLQESPLPEEYRRPSLPKEPPAPPQHQPLMNMTSMMAPKLLGMRPPPSFRPPPPTELPPPPPAHDSQPTYSRRLPTGLMSAGQTPVLATAPPALSTTPAALPPWGAGGSMQSGTMAMAPVWTPYAGDSSFGGGQWFSHSAQGSDATGSDLNCHAPPFEPAGVMGAVDSSAMAAVWAQTSGPSQLRAEADVYVPMNVGVQAW